MCFLFILQGPRPPRFVHLGFCIFKRPLGLQWLLLIMYYGLNSLEGTIKGSISVSYYRAY